MYTVSTLDTPVCLYIPAPGTWVLTPPRVRGRRGRGGGRRPDPGGRGSTARLARVAGVSVPLSELWLVYHQPNTPAIYTPLLQCTFYFLVLLKKRWRALLGNIICNSIRKVAFKTLTIYFPWQDNRAQLFSSPAIIQFLYRFSPLCEEWPRGKYR